MLTKRIIPCLDCDLQVPEGRVVKGVEFKQIRYAGNPVELATKYYEDGADEIVENAFGSIFDGKLVGTLIACNHRAILMELSGHSCQRHACGDGSGQRRTYCGQRGECGQCHGAFSGQDHIPQRPAVCQYHSGYDRRHL